MSIPLQYLAIWLSHYKYLILFPLAIFEGPVVTVLSGLLAAFGALNFLLAYLTVVLGDITADYMYYALGQHFGLKLPHRFMRLLGLDERRIEKVTQHFHAHPKKIFTLGKLSYGVGLIALFAAGVVKFPLKRFLLYNFTLTVAKSLLLMLVGFHFGRAYLNARQYIDYGAIITSLLLLAIYIIFIKYSTAQLAAQDDNGQTTDQT